MVYDHLDVRASRVVFDGYAVTAHVCIFVFAEEHEVPPKKGQVVFVLVATPRAVAVTPALGGAVSGSRQAPPACLCFLTSPPIIFHAANRSGLFLRISAL